MIKKKPSFLQQFLFAMTVFVLLESIATLVVWKIYDNKETFILERDAKVFDDVYKSTRWGYSKITKLLYDEIINTPEIIAIFKEASRADAPGRATLRRELYEALLPTYRSLQSINLRQLHFHLPDVTSFLRFHRPDKFGDNLSGIRRSIEVANRDLKYVEGFEEGRIYNGFRHVYPLFDEHGTHLGSVETSLSFRALSSDIEKTTGYHVDFVVKKTIVERKVWSEEQSNYYSSDISGDYLHEHEEGAFESKEEKHRAIKRILAGEASEKMRKNRRFALYAQGVIVSFIPVANIEGEPGAAYLISCNETDDIVRVHRHMSLVWGLSTLSVLLIVALGVLLFQKILKINELATRDALTGLYNRSSLSERIEMEIARNHRSEETFSLIYLDVDDFKKINDTYGHKSGDAVLKVLARVLKEHTRDMDSVGRWGGEEFLICLPNTDAAEAKTVAEKLREIIEWTYFEVPEDVTGSFGIATYRSGEKLDATVARADENLYRAKTQGKNQVCR
jgi:diguanylate cyclase (GGDEF)-like protein